MFKRIGLLLIVPFVLLNSNKKQDELAILNSIESSSFCASHIALQQRYWKTQIQYYLDVISENIEDNIQNEETIKENTTIVDETEEQGNTQYVDNSQYIDEGQQNISQVEEYVPEQEVPVQITSPAKDTIWEIGIIKNDDRAPVSNDIMRQASYWYNQIPAVIRDAIETADKGRWTITMTERDFSVEHGFNSWGIWGITDYNYNQITVSIDDPSTVIHEVAHFYNTHLQTLCLHDIFENLYNEERYKLRSICSTATSNMEKSSEYFAEAFRICIVYPEQSQIYIPKTYKFFSELAEGTLSFDIDIEGYEFIGKTYINHINLPDKLHYIGTKAFKQCSNLKSVTYKGTTYTNKLELIAALEADRVDVGEEAFDLSGLE